MLLVLLLLLGVLLLLRQGAALAIRNTWGVARVRDAAGVTTSARIRTTALRAAPAAGRGKGTCATCKGQGVVACKPCTGTGVDKVNGSVLERWCCKKCKGFGLVPCSACSSSTGLTPEQRGER
jgi:hypothetical protein